VSQNKWDKINKEINFFLRIKIIKEYRPVSKLPQTKEENSIDLNNMIPSFTVVLKSNWLR
jgi:hypothetical protein